MIHPIANIVFEIALVVSIAASAGTAWAYRRKIVRALAIDKKRQERL